MNLDEFIKKFGDDWLTRMMEIIDPLDHDTFIKRLYKEIDLIIKGLEEAPKERNKDSEDRISVEIVQNLRARGYVAHKDPTQGGMLTYVFDLRNEQTYAGSQKQKYGAGALTSKGA